MTDWIFESPDGENVYRRRSGDPSLTREFVSGHGTRKTLANEIDEIEQASNHDPILKEMIDKLRVYWSLKNGTN